VVGRVVAYHYPSIELLEHTLLASARVRQKRKRITPGQSLMKSILLVDDEPDLLAAWHLILSAEGYDVRCAAHGAQALEAIRERLPDLVITDWMMPVMGGAELCRRLRAQPNLAQVPILVHTSAPPPVNEAHAGGNAWNACLQKPVPMQIFLTTVGRLCAGTG
jgi:CheY-like chemotaxis protein